LSDKNLTNGDVPLGLGMAFAQNTVAMHYFTSLSKEERQQIINQAHNIKSKQEMRTFVDTLAKKDNRGNQSVM
jgi:uncharacterized protein YdeI (YjbR/CyaY-like superfamily)